MAPGQETKQLAICPLQTKLRRSIKMTIFLWLPLYAVALIYNSVLAAEQEQTPQDHDGRSNATESELRENEHLLQVSSSGPDLFSGHIAVHLHAEVGTYSESILGVNSPWMADLDREEDPSELGTESEAMSDDDNELAPLMPYFDLEEDTSEVGTDSESMLDDDDVLAPSMPYCVQEEDTGEVGTDSESMSDNDNELAPLMSMSDDDDELAPLMSMSDDDDDFAARIALIPDGPPGELDVPVGRGGSISDADNEVPELDASEGDMTASPLQICDSGGLQVDLPRVVSSDGDNAPSAHHASETAEPRQYVDEPREVDVLPGRGGLTNGHPGNRRFRKIVEDQKPEYANIKENEKKTKLAKKIVEAVSRNGARFLDRDQNDPPGRYFLMPLEKARRKTSQALREEKKAPK